MPKKVAMLDYQKCHRQSGCCEPIFYWDVSGMEKERFVVIGGVAAGMSAATRAKRNKPDPKVVVLERGKFVSCGLPCAQMIGKIGVSKRIDVFATALHSGMTVEEISRLDLSYSLPFAPFWDSILVAANVGLRKLDS